MSKPTLMADLTHEEMLDQLTIKLEDVLKLVKYDNSGLAMIDLANALKSQLSKEEQTALFTHLL